MLPDQIVASRMEEHREAPWISKRNQMALSGVELSVEHLEESNLVANSRRLVYPVSETWV